MAGKDLVLLGPARVEVSPRDIRDNADAFSAREHAIAKACMAPTPKLFLGKKGEALTSGPGSRGAEEISAALRS